MKHSKFKVIPLLTVLFLVFSIQIDSFAASALTGTSSLPKDYTKLNSLYQKALSAKNNADIAIYGQKIVDLFKGLPDTKQKLDITVPRFLNIAKANEVLGKDNKQNLYLAADAYVQYALSYEKQQLLNPKSNKAQLNSNVRYMLYSNAGRIYFDLLKDYGKALDVYNLVLKYDPENPGVTTKYFELGKIFETQGDYDKAIEVYTKYIPRAEKLGWKDGVVFAKTKLNVLSFDLELYTKSYDLSQSKYYGAKHEPKNGIYFGSTYDADPRIHTYNWDATKAYFPKKNSTYLTYLNWQEDARRFDRYYQDAKRNNIALEIAWNIDESSIQSVLANIESYKTYIESTAQYFGELNIPIFLRFAAEMNVKNNSKDSADFVKAFRYVADIVRSKAPNVAMVWSPNDISAKDRTYQEYYPGDEYVDWVGMSTYTSKYFQGKKDWGTMQETIDTTYFMGDYANPLSKMKPLIDLYGNRKPIMLSETGVSHYAKLAQEDLTSWAEIQFKRLYVYAPMIYPQLKGIYYFNVDNDAVSKYDGYALYTSEKMNKLYNEAVSSDYYLTQVGGNAPYIYSKISNNTINSLNIPLMTYTIVPKVLRPTVQYKIDNILYAAKTDLPYDISLDAGKLSKGEHILAVEVYDGSKKLRSKNYSVNVAESSVIIKEK